jgi:predicted nucleic acid-binding protein
LNGNKTIEKKAMQEGLNQIAISFISISELFYGAYKSQKVDQNLAAIRTIKSKLTQLDSNEELCRVFGKFKSELERDGKIIDDADLFIACCAVINNLVLVTNNEKHFSRIKGLKIENWMKVI